MESTAVFSVFNLLRTHMQDLKDVTQDIHYENYRAERLSRETGTPVGYKRVQDM